VLHHLIVNLPKSVLNGDKKRLQYLYDNQEEFVTMEQLRNFLIWLSNGDIDEIKENHLAG